MNPKHDAVGGERSASGQVNTILTCSNIREGVLD